MITVRSKNPKKVFVCICVHVCVNPSLLNSSFTIPLKIIRLVPLNFLEIFCNFQTSQIKTKKCETYNVRNRQLLKIQRKRLSKYNGWDLSMSIQPAFTNFKDHVVKIHRRKVLLYKQDVVVNMSRFNNSIFFRRWRTLPRSCPCTCC